MLKPAQSSSCVQGTLSRIQSPGPQHAAAHWKQSSLPGRQPQRHLLQAIQRQSLPQQELRRSSSAQTQLSAMLTVAQAGQQRLRQQSIPLSHQRGHSLSAALTRHQSLMQQSVPLSHQR